MNLERCHFHPGLIDPSSGSPHNYILYLDTSSICQSFFQTLQYLELPQYNLGGCSTDLLTLSVKENSCLQLVFVLQSKPLWLQLGKLAPTTQTALVYSRIIRMSSPVLNNVILIGCIVVYLTVFLQETSPTNISLLCKVCDICTNVLGAELLNGHIKGEGRKKKTEE